MTLKNNLYNIVAADRPQAAYSVGLNPECAIYKAHFPGLPITPGVCIIQIASELLADYLQCDVQLQEVCNAKFLAVINPLATSTVTIAFTALKKLTDDGRIKVAVNVADTNATYSKLSLIYLCND